MAKLAIPMKPHPTFFSTDLHADPLGTKSIFLFPPLESFIPQIFEATDRKPSNYISILHSIS